MFATRMTPDTPASDRPPVRAAVIGLAHPHIFSMAHAVVQAGASLVAWLDEPGPLAEPFARQHPEARAVRDAREILEDPAVELVLAAGVPSERAPLGLEVMRHGKDFLVDKPGVTTLEQLARVRRVQAETGRIYSVCFSERFESRATVRASELVRAGAIGRVLQTVGLGPHRLRAEHRPPWFFERERTGGILTDLASHQIDQFLHFTGVSSARVRSARTANLAHAEHPELEDFGELLLEADAVSGYVRVDWFTPDGLPTWGDGRLVVLGSDGFIEVRKYVDLEGRPGGDHLFWVDQKGTHYVDCKAVPLPFGGQLLDDVVERGESAMPQALCFLACELALRAQAVAEQNGSTSGAGNAP
jgi:predicted dehydrogenase